MNLTVTAGNASGVNDGAAALIVASEAAAQAQGLTPRARIVGMAAAGVEPRVMGVGPVPAVRKLLASGAGAGAERAATGASVVTTASSEPLGPSFLVLENMGQATSQSHTGRTGW